jgi:hypothetical protein
VNGRVATPKEERGQGQKSRAYSHGRRIQVRLDVKGAEGGREKDTARGLVAGFSPTDPTFQLCPETHDEAQHQESGVYIFIIFFIFFIFFVFFILFIFYIIIFILVFLHNCSQ